MTSSLWCILYHQPTFNLMSWWLFHRLIDYPFCKRCSIRKASDFFFFFFFCSFMHVFEYKSSTMIHHIQLRQKIHGSQLPVLYTNTHTFTIHKYARVHQQQQPEKNLKRNNSNSAMNRKSNAWNKRMWSTAVNFTSLKTMYFLVHWNGITQ